MIAKSCDIEAGTPSSTQAPGLTPVFFGGFVLLIYLGFLYCVFALFVFVLCHVPKCCLFGSPPVLNTEVHFVHFVLLCVFTFLVPCCDVSYNVRIKTMVGSSLPLVACKRNHVLLCFFFVCLRIVRSNILSYHMSLRTEFRALMTVTISA